MKLTVWNTLLSGVFGFPFELLSVFTVFIGVNNINIMYKSFAMVYIQQEQWRMMNIWVNGRS